MKRNYDIGVKLTKEEEERIKNKADKLGMTKSEYVRFVCLNANIEISKAL